MTTATPTLISPQEAARLLIASAEKILDLRHGEGYAAAHPDDVGEFLMDVSMDLWVKQADILLASLPEL